MTVPIPATTKLVVVWRVTERCDLACPFCGFDRTLRRSRREAAEEDVRPFGAVLGCYRRETGMSVLVSWLGGEPLLWPQFVSMSSEFHSHYGLALATTTNGTRLDRPAIRACLLRHFSELTVSVDGFAPCHDMLRGHAGLFDALRASVSQLARDKRACGSQLLLRANVVLMRGSVESFLPLCLELARWGIEEITFNQLGGNDRPKFHPDHRLLAGEADLLAEALPRWNAELAAHGARLRGSADYLRRIVASSHDQRIAPTDCAPGRMFLFIDERGRASPCSFTSCDYGLPLAQLDSPGAIRRLPSRFEELARERRPRACADCRSTQVFGKFTPAQLRNEAGAAIPVPAP